jgi:hypothetical protein
MTKSFKTLERVLLEYENYLLRAENFSLKHPDEIHGYNMLLEEAELKRRIAINLGAIELKPLPPYKQ